MKSLLFKALVLVSSLLFTQGYAKDKSSMKENNLPVVVVETTQGSIEITLRPDLAPKTCENFLGHIRSGYYEGTTFHRIIKSFMIQGGDPTGTGSGGTSIWNKEFADEFSPKASFNKVGLLAMANRGPNTNGSQFFITTAETPWLNNRHTIFGEVTKGYDIVQKLESVPTKAQDRPVETQKIIKIYEKK